MTTFPIKYNFEGSNLQYLWHPVLTMKKIIRNSRVGEIGEKKLTHKIEITLFTEIVVC